MDQIGDPADQVIFVLIQIAICKGDLPEMEDELDLLCRAVVVIDQSGEGVE